MLPLSTKTLLIDILYDNAWHYKTKRKKVDIFNPQTYPFSIKELTRNSVSAIEALESVGREMDRIDPGEDAVFEIAPWAYVKNGD